MQSLRALLPTLLLTSLTLATPALAQVPAAQPAQLPLPAPQAAPVPVALPAHVGRRHSTPADLQAIQQVTDDFRTALRQHDARGLSALLLNNRILFSSPASPQRVRQTRAEVDLQADGVAGYGAIDFLRFVASAKQTIEERFHNLQITQDGHLAWVQFDFEFIEDGRVENHGVEVWQMLKTADERWKILSVLWSSHGAPR